MNFPQPRKPGGMNKKPLFNMYWMYVLLGLSILALFWFQDASQVKDVNWTEFEQAATRGDINKIMVFAENRTAEGYLTPQGAKNMDFDINDRLDGERKIKTTIPSNDKIQEKIDSWNASLKAEGKPEIEVNYEKGSDLMKVFWYFGPIILIVVFMVYMSRRMTNGGSGGGIFSVGKSRAAVFDKNNGTNVTFKDVAGLAEAKVEIEEIVEFLKNPQRYTELGAKIPKGALLVGPPGTGKTLLAKAVAGEANVPFLSMSGSDFVEMFVGVGAARVRDLFKQAKDKAPCIVFIDEIDAIGRARGKNAGFSGNDERENTLNQLLTEMDGFQTNTGVIVLAATNRADILDKALMRAGRFDRQIEVGLPDVKEREAIFNVHLRPLKLDPQLDREFLARQTPGFSGADIANVCNEAALIAARHNKKFVSKEDFLAAIDRIVGGLEKPNMPMTAAERRATAIHEAGHATVMWSLPQCDPVLKVTVVPRGRSLGATWYVPDERRIHVTNEALQERLAGLLGGRIAEEVSYGTLGAGALSDLERATETAYAMVAYYGMSKKIGPISYYDSSGTRDTFTKPFSEQTAHDIDTEVRRIIEEAYAKARGIIERKSEQINRMADLLLEKETIYAEDIERILGPAAQVPRENDEPKKGVVVADDDAASGTASAPADAPPAGTGTTQEGDAGSASGTKTAASGAANAEKSELN